MTTQEVLAALQSYGNENTKRTHLKHGAKEPLFGVKVQDLKTIQKKVKKDHRLALELYATGNSDAMYLAGLIADENQVTKRQLQQWVEEASWYMISEYTVPWLAADSPHGFELGLEWIESDQEKVAAAGWATLASYASLRPDTALDINVYSQLVDRAAQNVHQAQNRVRYTMNGFVIAIGCFIESLTEKAQEAAKKMGKISVDVGGTACKVPLATDYIQKVIDKGRIGKKRKMARC